MPAMPWRPARCCTLRPHNGRLVQDKRDTWLRRSGFPTNACLDVSSGSTAASGFWQAWGRLSARAFWTLRRDRIRTFELHHPRNERAESMLVEIDHGVVLVSQRYRARAVGHLRHAGANGIE